MNPDRSVALRRRAGYMRMPMQEIAQLRLGKNLILKWRPILECLFTLS